MLYVIFLLLSFRFHSSLIDLYIFIVVVVVYVYVLHSFNFIMTNIYYCTGVIYMSSYSIFSFPYWVAFPVSALGFIAVSFTSGVCSLHYRNNNNKKAFQLKAHHSRIPINPFHVIVTFDLGCFKFIGIFISYNMKQIGSL